jgi:hypothetical protein
LRPRGRRQQRGEHEQVGEECGGEAVHRVAHVGVIDGDGDACRLSAQPLRQSDASLQKVQLLLAGARHVVGMYFVVDAPLGRKGDGEVPQGARAKLRSVGLDLHLPIEAR